MALILAADTSTSVNTVALCSAVADGTVALCAETAAECARGHAERLVETVDWVLRQASVGVAEVDLLAVSVGPGSFTGLRIGVATFKGLAFACAKPLCAVPTLDALARAAGIREGVVCPLLDARMGEVYGAVYDYHAGQRETRIPAQASAIEALLDSVEGPVYCLGDGAARFRDRIAALLPEAAFAPAWQSCPRAAAVAAEGWALACAGAPSDADAVAPVYLRHAKVDLRGVPAPHAAEAGRA